MTGRDFCCGNFAWLVGGGVVGDSRDIGERIRGCGGGNWEIGRRVAEAGMVGGGVEATIQGEEFTGLGHTEQHFAAGFVVVASGGKNVFDGTGIGTFV